MNSCFAYLPVSVPSAAILELVFHCALVEGLDMGWRLPLHIERAQEPRVSDLKVSWRSNYIKNKAEGKTECQSEENKPKAAMKVVGMVCCYDLLKCSCWMWRGVMQPWLFKTLFSTNTHKLCSCPSPKNQFLLVLRESTQRSLKRDTECYFLTLFFKIL